MLKHRDLTQERCRLFGDTLRALVYRERVPVSLSAYAAPDRISFSDAVKATYTPIEIGHRFAPPWSTHWVKIEAEVPEGWKRGDIHLLWNSSSEACVWQDGVPLRGLTDPHHQAFRITPDALNGSRFTCMIEVACNTLFGVEGIGADVPEGLGRLKQAEVALLDPTAWSLLWDYLTVAEMAEHLPGTPRGEQALRVANDMVNAFDAQASDSLTTMREIGRGFLAEPNGDNPFTLSAVGHAHIDTAWLWPLAETVRKCYRSFATVLRNMEAYPDFKFACSQAQQWTWMEDRYPEVYAQMKARAAEGRFVPAGGSWVEFDCNIPSGESMMRQFLYGQRYFGEKLGIRCREFWNPDVFGYSGQLPQILKHCEIDYFLTQKLSWNQFNKLPHQTFYWEAINGSRVLTHFPPADNYNAVCTIEETVQTVKNYRDLDRVNRAYHLFGYGDGGGGPTTEMLERLDRLQNLNGLPALEQCTPGDFFQRLEAESTDLQTWVGELYFELHRGTYTTHARNKKHNRRCERLLQNTECLWAILDRDHYPGTATERLWKIVLLNQFHDIIPGSSIKEVYADSGRQYAEVLNAGSALREQALESLIDTDGDRLLAVNLLSTPRREVVELPQSCADAAQALPDGRALGVVAAPALGYAVTAPARTEDSLSVEESSESAVLENDLVRVTLSRDGRVTGLFDKRVDRELIEEGVRGNNLVLFDDYPNQWDAWDVDAFHLEKRRDMPAANAMRVDEAGPLRGAMTFTYAADDGTTVQQTVRLSAVSPRIDFVTEVEWKANKTFLKVEFPWALRSDHADYEIQYGSLPRPTHFNTSWDMARFEVCAHRWAALSEPDYGIALLNDCKYGYSTHGNVMRLSLLRATTSPDPGADRGTHSFTYSILPYPGSLLSAGVVQEAERLNVPLLLRSTNRPESSKAWFETDQPAVIIDTVKRAEDSDAVILRLYEAYGTRGRVRLTSSLPFTSAALCSGLEDEQEALAWSDRGVELAYRPFQLMTLKLT